VKGVSGHDQISPKLLSYGNEQNEGVRNPKFDSSKIRTTLVYMYISANNMLRYSHDDGGRPRSTTKVLFLQSRLHVFRTHPGQRSRGENIRHTFDYIQ